MQPAFIAGIGTAHPRYSISQANSASVAETFIYDSDGSKSTLPALYRMTRVAKRGSVLLEGPSETDVHQSFYPQASDSDDRGPCTQQRMEQFESAAGELAIESAGEALRDAQCDPQEITHLITVTCTGFYAPGFDVELIAGLPLSPDVERIQIGFMGCHAFVNALRTARAVAASDPSATVLVVAVELCSLHYQYGWDTDRIVSNALFADGSAAVVVRSSPPQSPDRSVPSITATGSRLLPDTQSDMTWRVGNHGYQMTLAASVPGRIEANLSDYLIPWLEARDLSVEAIGGWATHPGGPRVLGAVETAMKLDRSVHDISREVLSEHGNMSSATLVFILQRMRAANIPLPWLMLGFGPGLEIELALLT